MTYQEAYSILGINSQTSMEQIKQAYKKQAKKHHPDIYQGDKKFAEEKMRKINEAYHFLTSQSSEPHSYSQYDEMFDKSFNEFDEMIKNAFENIESMRKAREQARTKEIKSQKQILKWSIFALIFSIITFISSVIVIDASIHWILSAFFFFIGFLSFLAIIFCVILIICAAYLLKHTDYI